jgi:hypothetical protein
MAWCGVLTFTRAVNSNADGVANPIDRRRKPSAVRWLTTAVESAGRHPEVDALAWWRLALLGGTVVDGRTLDARSCAAQAVRQRPRCPHRRLILAELLSGTDRAAHTEQALSLCDAHAAAWHVLGHCGGGTVRGELYTATTCMGRALSIRGALMLRGAARAAAWRALAAGGGGRVSGVTFDRRDCLVEALLLQPRDVAAWRGLLDLYGEHAAADVLVLERRSLWLTPCDRARLTAFCASSVWLAFTPSLEDARFAAVHVAEGVCLP